MIKNPFAYAYSRKRQRGNTFTKTQFLGRRTSYAVKLIKYRFYPTLLAPTVFGIVFQPFIDYHTCIIVSTLFLCKIFYIFDNKMQIKYTSKIYK